MEYPEIGSIQFASTMDHYSEDDMDLCQTEEDDDDMNVVSRSYSDDDSDTTVCRGGDELVDIDDKELIAELRREGRKYAAKDFRREFIYSGMEQKTFVCPDGTFSRMDKSSGIVWVGVHGTDSICVVTRTGDLDVTRVLGFLKHFRVEAVLCKFRKTIISELEDLASPPSKLRERFGHGIPKPFGVVSVFLGTEKVHKESGHEASSDEDEDEKDKVMKVMPVKVESGLISSAEMREQVRKLLREDGKSRPPSLPTYDEKKTIKYLQEQMGRETTVTINETIKASSTKYDVTEATKFLQEKMEASTVDETVKTAISAFQILFGNKKFKADEIEVSVMDPNYFYTTKDPNYKDLYVKHLVMSDIEDYLAAINEPSSGSSSSVGSCSGGSSGSGGPTNTFCLGIVDE